LKSGNQLHDSVVSLLADIESNAWPAQGDVGDGERSKKDRAFRKTECEDKATRGCSPAAMGDSMVQLPYAGIGAFGSGTPEARKRQ
jgi:hypothetical protein